MPPVWHQVSHHLDGSSREAAKATAHVVASMRVQRRSQAHETWRDMSRTGDGKLSNHVHCFLAPSTARLDGEDDQSASLRRGQLWVGCLLDVSCSLQHNTPSTSAACGCGSPELHNALTRVTSTASCAPPARKILGEDLHSTLIPAGNSNVHITEICIVSHLGESLPENSCHHSLDGSGPLLETTCPRARGSVASKGVHRVTTPLTRGFRNRKWKLQPLQQEHAEQERRNRAFVSSWRACQRTACAVTRM